MIYDTENQVSLKGFLSRAEQKDTGLPSDCRRCRDASCGRKKQGRPEVTWQERFSAEV